MITVEDALRALGFTPQQIEEEAARSASPDPLGPRPNEESEVGEDPWWTSLYPLTIEVGPKNVVPGFNTGDRIRLVQVREDRDDIVQLTPEDVRAISNLIEHGPDYKPQSEMERVWRMILATVDRFPGSKIVS